jgi:hypothetical protein
VVLKYEILAVQSYVLQLIAQKSLNNYFSRCGEEPKVYRNSVCEIRKGEIYTKASNRGRKKENL